MYVCMYIFYLLPYSSFSSLRRIAIFAVFAGVYSPKGRPMYISTGILCDRPARIRDSAQIALFTPQFGVRSK